MKHKILVSPTLAALIRRQHGMVATSQAKDNGVTEAAIRRLSLEGHWHHVTRNLWSVSPVPGWEALAWGGIILGGDGATLGGHAAAHLWNLVAEPEVIEVWAHTKRRLRTGPWQFRRGVRKSHGELPKVLIENAVVEACAGAGTDNVISILAKALSSGRTTAQRLHKTVAASSNLPGRKLLLELLGEAQLGVESPLELRYLHDVERAHGLPHGTRQRSNSVATRTDVTYPEYATLVELDGRVHHQGLAAHLDMGRDNDHRLLGLFTLRYGWVIITADPCLVAAQVARALRLGGWEGEPTTCHRCAGAPVTQP